MATSKAQKVQTVSLLQNTVAPQSAVVLLTTQGAEETLNAANNVSLRQQAHASGVGLTVVKNTLISRVFGSSAGFPEQLVGPTFVVYSKVEGVDEVAVPKTIVELVEDKFGKQFAVLGSIVNGEFLDSNRTKQLAKTPSKLQSMAQLAGVLQRLGGGMLGSLLKDSSAQIARAVGEVAKTKTA